MYTSAFFMLMVSSACLRLATLMLVTMVPLHAFEVGLSSTEVGLTAALYFVSAALVRPISGWLSDFGNRCLVMISGASMITLAVGLYFLPIPVWLFLALRAVQGAGFSLNSTASMAFASQMIPEKRMIEGVNALSLEQMMIQVTAPWLAITLFENFGANASYVVVLSLCIGHLTMRALLFRMPQVVALPAKSLTSAPPTDTEHTLRLSNLIQTDALRLASIMLFFMFGASSVSTFLAVYALSLGIDDSALFFLSSGISLVLSRIILQSAGRHLPPVAIVTIGLASGATSLFTIYVATDIGGLVVAGVLFGISTGVIAPTINALTILSVTKSARGRASATYFLSMDTGNALGAWTLGLLASATSLRDIFLAAGISILFGIGALTWLFVRGKMNPPRSATT